jgi:hypothetical protein
MPWLRQLVSGLSPKRPGSARVGFVVDKVALRQGFQFSFVNIIPSWLSIYIYIYITRGMKNRHVGSHSSKIMYHPIDMNKAICTYMKFNFKIHKPTLRIKGNIFI